MLKTVRFTEKFQSDGCVMLLGGFDGLHLGHKQLMRRAQEYALPVGVMTIVGGKEAKSLFTFREREEIFRAHGADFAFELPFSEIKDLSPQAFVELLIEEFRPKAFVCGDDFRFGKGACGSAQTLKECGRIRVDVERLVTTRGEKISSSSIKKYLTAGEVERANELLGEEFFLVGEVIKDRGIGKTLGFPTANIVYPSEKFQIKKGVYETRVHVNGKEYMGITNYGNRPTFQDQTVITETYLDGFDGELYGKTLQVRFVRFLREIKTFENVEKLKEQLKEDIRRVREK
ncbi:MAG: riboflavin biosynthesis protein RibF [Clostridia bacterium]|nr:riboflavin biosynthesis protein RibF [Clostridia bacterium]